MGIASTRPGLFAVVQDPIDLGTETDDIVDVALGDPRWPGYFGDAVPLPVAVVGTHPLPQRSAAVLARRMLSIPTPSGATLGTGMRFLMPGSGRVSAVP